MPLTDELLDRRMTEIEQARSWSPRVISKLEGLIRDGTDKSLYRLNPLAFAQDRMVGEAEAIDLFLHAAQFDAPLRGVEASAHVYRIKP